LMADSIRVQLRGNVEIRVQLRGSVEIALINIGPVHLTSKGQRRSVAVALAVETDDKNTYTIRCAHLAEPSVQTLTNFIQTVADPYAKVFGSGWTGIDNLRQLPQEAIIPQEITTLRPRTQAIAKRIVKFVAETYGGSIHIEHLQYYLAEFVFRMNSRVSRPRGRVFYRLVRQACESGPISSKEIFAGHPKA
jgi:hypothetical protein